MKIGTYNPNDASNIEQLFIQAFSDAEGPSEGEMIGRLVRNYLTGTDAPDFYCFTAVDSVEVLGSIFFSRITFESDINAFILSPVAVRTDAQNQGIGQRLIRYGLDDLSKRGVELVITYGDPVFYRKVGFEVVPETKIPAPLSLTYPDGWMAQSLTDKEIPVITGNSACVAALNDPEYW